jgi:large subunit ribosomal protein L2
VIDFKRKKDGVPAKVATIEYDPNRSARIALCTTPTARSATSSRPKGLSVGDVVQWARFADIKPRQRPRPG